MNLSNTIAQMIMQMLAEQDGQAEIRRNELAERLGCVPSQINYVISSRFTPEHGYLVESRRGGGGYIRITRANFDAGTALMHVVNTVGDALDEATLRAHVYNLHANSLLDMRSAQMILAAGSENALRDVAPGLRERVRARIFKNMLVTFAQ